MSKQAFSQLAILAIFLSVNGCNLSPKKAAQNANTSDAKTQTLGETVSGLELRKQYQAANSEFEHRALCLRAIDEGLIRRGGPVSALDEIFGTHFASELPKGSQLARDELILFASQPEPRPRPDGLAAGRDYVGWYMAVSYDQKGLIENYHLTNLHKGNGSPRVEKKLSTVELRRLYQAAQSESDRRGVCLQAIDGGALVTYQSVAPVDEIFGTHFATDLPDRREGIRKANIEFVDSQSTERSGWHLGIEYDSQGTLLSYQLTNVHR